uniref:Uncharacterized protein n=1 Tax=Anguilla anguilla TaxID=7936 RepID=A0A0E9UAQ5_ANGAN
MWGHTASSPTALRLEPSFQSTGEHRGHAQTG